MNASEREALVWWGALSLYLLTQRGTPEGFLEVSPQLLEEFAELLMADVVAIEDSAQSQVDDLKDATQKVRGKDGAEFEIVGPCVAESPDGSELVVVDIPMAVPKPLEEFALEQRAALGAFLAASYDDTDEGALTASFEGWVDAGYEVRKLWRALVVVLSKMPREDWPPFEQLKVVVP